MRISDWSSDVCSSDRPDLDELGAEREHDLVARGALLHRHVTGVEPGGGVGGSTLGYEFGILLDDSRTVAGKGLADPDGGAVAGDHLAVPQVEAVGVEAGEGAVVGGDGGAEPPRADRIAGLLDRPWSPGSEARPVGEEGVRTVRVRWWPLH